MTLIRLIFADLRVDKRHSSTRKSVKNQLNQCHLRFNLNTGQINSPLHLQPIFYEKSYTISRLFTLFYPFFSL
jgi:hypothetical protein